MSFEIHQLIGPYALERLLGRGTFGEVWLAIHQDLGERRALKIPTDPRYVQQLRREGKIIYSLQHVNIVRGCDMNTLDDPPYVAMEYVEGVTLRQRLKTAGKLPVAEALAILRQILAALAHAHDNGVLHRDLKPENVLLTAGGQVKVTDFGLGKVQAEVSQSIVFSGSMVTGDGRSVAGTVQYMSPQQQAGEQPDVRDDVYAAGVIACELITGSRPSPIGVAKMLQRAKIHAVVASLLEKALEHDPSDRYGSAMDMLWAVDGLPTALAEAKRAKRARAELEPQPSVAVDSVFGKSPRHEDAVQVRQNVTVSATTKPAIPNSLAQIAQAARTHNLHIPSPVKSRPIGVWIGIVIGVSCFIIYLVCIAVTVLTNTIEGNSGQTYTPSAATIGTPPAKRSSVESAASPTVEMRPGQSSNKGGSPDANPPESLRTIICDRFDQHIAQAQDAIGKGDFTTAQAAVGCARQAAEFRVDVWTIPELNNFNMTITKTQLALNRAKEKQ